VAAIIHFDTVGAMPAANEFIWLHHDEVNGFPEVVLPWAGFNLIFILLLAGLVALIVNLQRLASDPVIGDFEPFPRRFEPQGLTLPPPRCYNFLT